MRISADNIDVSFGKIRERSTWNIQVNEELRMHKIHVYPAKFPSFLISKSLEYANNQNITVNSIGDIFCGCGTTALEAKKFNKSFWGCDINPVATLIAKVKRGNYDVETLTVCFENIVQQYVAADCETPADLLNHERINYWFHVDQIRDLYKLLTSIRANTEDDEYREFFYVAFSNILKRTSKWLTKSIKPQIDPVKPIYAVLKAFKYQFKVMKDAVVEVNDTIQVQPEAEIINKNFLKTEYSAPFIDMLICSPPYVTSYEYADLHQLSTMWLGYTNDFRELREGTIGSVYNHLFNVDELNDLDPEILQLYNRLKLAKMSGPRSVIKYFVDIKETINKTYSIVNNGGLAVFVIGNTTFKNVYVNNAKFIAKYMIEKGFEEVEVFKRKISGKILTPYRDENGKFSNDKNDRKVYSYEFVILAKKPNG